MADFVREFERRALEAELRDAPESSGSPEDFDDLRVEPTLLRLEQKLDNGLVQVNSRIDNLHVEMDKRFTQTDNRIDKLHTEMDRRFAALQAEMDRRFELFSADTRKNFELVRLDIELAKKDTLIKVLGTVITTAGLLFAALRYLPAAG